MHHRMRCLFRLAEPEARPADTLAILLPGAYNRAEDFLAAGFAEPAASAGIDLCLPDLSLPQLGSGEALPLVHDDVIAPARAAGVKTIWLGGVSLGGFNSLCYADRYEGTPGAVDGLCLLAPWPGSRITRNLINAAGGLDCWQPSDDADAEQRVWYWLRRQRYATTQSATRLPIFIGWGDSDRFANGIAAYAEAMPEARRAAIPGGHDWAVWGMLWQRFCAGLRPPSGVAK